MDRLEIKFAMSKPERISLWSDKFMLTRLVHYSGIKKYVKLNYFLTSVAFYTRLL